LAGTDGDLAAEQLLLQPEFIEPRRRERLDAARSQDVAEAAAGQPAAMDLVGVGVEREAGYAGQLLQVRVKLKIETPLVKGRASERDGVLS